MKNISVALQSQVLCVRNLDPSQEQRAISVLRTKTGSLVPESISLQEANTQVAKVKQKRFNNKQEEKETIQF